MLPVSPKLIIAAGAAIVLAVCAIWLVNIGQEFSELKTANAQCQKSLVNASENARDLEAALESQTAASEDLAATAREAQALYEELLARPTRIVRIPGETIIERVPLGNCDRAATSAWDVLNDGGFISPPEVSWNDSSSRLDSWLATYHSRLAEPPPPTVLPSTPVLTVFAWSNTPSMSLPSSGQFVSFQTFPSSPQE